MYVNPGILRNLLIKIISLHHSFALQTNYSIFTFISLKPRIVLLTGTQYHSETRWLQ